MTSAPATRTPSRPEARPFRTETRQRGCRSEYSTPAKCREIASHATAHAFLAGAIPRQAPPTQRRQPIGPSDGARLHRPVAITTRSPQFEAGNPQATRMPRGMRHHGLRVVRCPFATPPSRPLRPRPTRQALHRPTETTDRAIGKVRPSAWLPWRPEAGRSDRKPLATPAGSARAAGPAPARSRRSTGPSVVSGPGPGGCRDPRLAVLSRELAGGAGCSVAVWVSWSALRDVATCALRPWPARQAPHRPAEAINRAIGGVRPRAGWPSRPRLAVLSRSPPAVPDAPPLPGCREVPLATPPLAHCDLGQRRCPGLSGGSRQGHRWRQAQRPVAPRDQKPAPSREPPAAPDAPPRPGCRESSPRDPGYHCDLAHVADPAPPAEAARQAHQHRLARARSPPRSEARRPGQETRQPCECHPGCPPRPGASSGPYRVSPTARSANHPNLDSAPASGPGRARDQAGPAGRIRRGSRGGLFLDRHSLG
jgi:hypothetical protein